MTAPLTMSQVSLASLTTYPGNPRRGDVHVIAQSLQRRGQYKPIVVSSDDVVLAGNHTYLAAKQLGWFTIDVVRMPFAADTEQARELVLVDNRSADHGTYDDRELLELLRSLGDVDDLAIGYDSADVDALAALLEEHGQGDPLPDDTDDQVVLDETDETRWPSLTFQLPPGDRARWAEIEQENDTERARYLLAVLDKHEGR